MEKLIAFLVAVLIGFFLGGFCFDYSITFWASLIKGYPVAIPFLPCGVAGMIFGSVAVPLAVITWIFSFVL